MANNMSEKVTREFLEDLTVVKYGGDQSSLDDEIIEQILENQSKAEKLDKIVERLCKEIEKRKRQTIPLNDWDIDQCNRWIGKLLHERRNGKVSQ